MEVLLKALLAAYHSKLLAQIDLELAAKAGDPLAEEMAVKLCDTTSRERDHLLAVSMSDKTLTSRSCFPLGETLAREQVLEYQQIEVTSGYMDRAAEVVRIAAGLAVARTEVGPPSTSHFAEVPPENRRRRVCLTERAGWIPSIWHQFTEGARSAFDHTPQLVPFAASGAVPQ